jgi:hypothetical protein
MADDPSTPITSNVVRHPESGHSDQQGNATGPGVPTPNVPSPGSIDQSVGDNTHTTTS